MKISLKRKAYEEAGVPSAKAPSFATDTIRANPAERLPPLVFEEEEEMKTEPKIADLPSPTATSPLLSMKRSGDEELTLNSLNAEPDKDDPLEDGELRDEESTKDDHAFILTDEGNIR